MSGNMQRRMLPDDDNLDLSDFGPRPEKPVRSVSQAEIQRHAEQHGLPSRAPRPAAPIPEAGQGRQPNLYRTGRSANFSCRAKPEVVDQFYSLVAENGWKTAEGFELAVEALAEGAPPRAGGDVSVRVALPRAVWTMLRRQATDNGTSVPAEILAIVEEQLKALG